MFCPFSVLLSKYVTKKLLLFYVTTAYKFVVGCKILPVLHAFVISVILHRRCLHNGKTQNNTIPALLCILYSFKFYRPFTKKKNKRITIFVLGMQMFLPEQNINVIASSVVVNESKAHKISLFVSIKLNPSSNQNPLYPLKYINHVIPRKQVIHLSSLKIYISIKGFRQYWFTAFVIGCSPEILQVNYCDIQIP